VIALIALLVLVAIPIAEITVLIEVGGVIGTWPTVALVVLTAVLGTALIRWQGMAVLAEVRRGLDEGRPPLAAAVDGLFLLLAGALLLTPGFLTDTLGFLCLIPPLRHWVARAAMRWLLRHGEVQVRSGGMGAPGRRRDVIEGEFVDITDAPAADDRDEEGGAARPPRPRASPWAGGNGAAGPPGDA